ncbi:MAG: TolC family protein, partial [Pseudomonadota bacterium]|nr:TolC family protein [Pseudomonadota bacterium]
TTLAPAATRGRRIADHTKTGGVFMSSPSARIRAGHRLGAALLAGAVLCGPSAAAAQDAPAIAAPADPAALARPGENEPLRAAIIELLRKNPDIQIALARQDDARYAIGEARAAHLPRIDLSLASGPEYVLPYQATDNTVLRRSEGVLSLHQNIWDFGATINDIKRARAAFSSAEWNTREQIERIAFETTAAYLSLLEKQRTVELIEEEIATQAKMSRTIQVQKDLGLTTAADVSRAQVRQDNLQAQLLDAQSQLQQQRESYRRLTGHLPGRATDLPPVDTALPADADAAVQMIEDHNPELAQAVQNRRSIEKQLLSQKAAFYPRIGLDAQANLRNEVMGRTGRNEDARVVVTLTYNILRGGADYALMRRIEARVRESDYEVDRVRRNVEQDLRIDFQSLAAANDKMATIESQVAAAEKVVTLYREQFRSGNRSVFDLLDTQQALFQARLNRLTNFTQKQVSGLRVLQKLAGLFDFVSGGQPLTKYGREIVVPRPPARIGPNL